MKLNKLALIGTSMLLAGNMVSTTASAEELEFSANVAMTTDYVWRGNSQTNNDMAIQGGFDASYGMFYAGTWGSNVSFGASEMEWDLYAGVSDTFAEDFTWDVGILGYKYPGDTQHDFTELYAGIGYKWVSLYVYEQISDPGAASGDANREGMTYWQLSGEVELMEGFGLNASYGSTNYDLAGADDYEDWKIGITKSFGGFDFELAYTDTDSLLAANQSKINEGHAMLMVSKSF